MKNLAYESNVSKETEDPTSVKRKASDEDKLNMEEIYKSIKQREYRIRVAIPRDTVWNDLHKLFSLYGTISKILVSEIGSKDMKGSAFVTFEEEKAMEKALEAELTLNGVDLITKKSYDKHDIQYAIQQLGNKKLKIEADPNRQVFVAPLNHKSKLETVTDALEIFGDVTTVMMPSRPNGSNIGYAIVTYQNGLGAGKAVSAGSIEIDDTTVTINRAREKKEKPDDEAEQMVTEPVEESDEIDDTTVTINRAREKVPSKEESDDEEEQMVPEPVEESDEKLTVQTLDSLPCAAEGSYALNQECVLKAIDPDVDLQSLLDVYGKFGSILDIQFIKKSKRINSARIVFAKAISVFRVTKAGHIQIGKSRIVAMALDKEGDPAVPFYLPQHRLFVSNLDFSWRKRDLVEYFSNFGPIVDIRMPFCKDIQCNKGYAYINYRNDESAMNALRKSSHKIGSWALKVVGRRDFLTAKGPKEKKFTATTLKVAKAAKKAENREEKQKEKYQLKTEEENKEAIQALGVQPVNILELVNTSKCLVDKDLDGDEDNENDDDDDDDDDDEEENEEEGSDEEEEEGSEEEEEGSDAEEDEDSDE